MTPEDGYGKYADEYGYEWSDFGDPETEWPVWAFIVLMAPFAVFFMLFAVALLARG